MAAIRRLHKAHLRSLFSLACITQPSLQSNNYSQAFRRTLSMHSQTLSNPSQVPTFQPCSPQSLYNPIDFHELNSISSDKNDLGSVKFVELVQKTKGFVSKKEGFDSVFESGVKVDSNQVYFAIWLLRNDWELALLVFELSEKWGLGNDKILGLIVWVLGSHQKFDIAWSLIRDVHSVFDTRRAMLAVIERYAAGNCHEKAIKTFNFMENLSASPDQNSLYSLLTALCKYGNVEEAEEFMLKNKKLFSLETDGFNIILHAWCTISIDIFEAKSVWREMASNCITPDAISYTHLISCVSRAGNLFDSLRLYDEMKKRGWVPGLEVYNSLILAMTRGNCLSEALKLLKKIKEMGVQPDSSSYDCVICPRCEAGKFEEAKALFITMSGDGVEPTLDTYKALLTSGDLDGTLYILQKMKNDKVGLDSSIFLLIFDRFFKLKQPENVLKVWVEMEYFGVIPDSTHYSSLINGLANCGCLMKAKEMYFEMISNGFVDDPKLKKLVNGFENETHRGRIVAMPACHVRNRPHRGRQKMRR